MSRFQSPPCTCPSVSHPAGRFQLWALIAGLVFIHGALQAATVKDVRKKMGSRFEITAISPSQDDAQLAIDAAYDEIDRIEALISSWRETSETSAVNAHAGKGPVPVSHELFNLVRRALKVSNLTDGAFDITFAGAGRLWDFKSSDPQLPEADEIRRAVAVVDYKLVELNEEAGTIHLTKPGMRIGLGAIVIPVV